MARLENGDNNGAFFLSVRKGAEWTGLGKNAVNSALHELQDKGFIYCAERGGFSRKTPHAASWGLTWLAGPKGSEHRAPSHAYEKWQPADFAGPQNRDSAVPKTGTVGQKNTPDCPEKRDSKLPGMAEIRQSELSRNRGHIIAASPPQALGPANDRIVSTENDGGPICPFGWFQPDFSATIGRLALLT